MPKSVKFELLLIITKTKKMTPKEKASELFNHMFNHISGCDKINRKTNARLCALIAVYEIINSGPYSPTKGGMKEYWEEVEKELNGF